MFVLISGVFFTALFLTSPNKRQTPKSDNEFSFVDFRKNHDLKLRKINRPANIVLSLPINSPKPIATVLPFIPKQPCKVLEFKRPKK